MKLPFAGLISREYQKDKLMDYTKQQFERWFKDHYPMMYRLAFSLVEDAEDARDAVHQMFTEMWHRQPQLDEKAVASYLLAATRNQCLHTLRKRKVQREVEREFQQNGETAQARSHEELMKELQLVIDRHLTPQDRRILALHYDEEMTYSQTAKALGISSSAVNKHISGSLKKIRNILKKAR